jgi:hypothetical protein
MIDHASVQQVDLSWVAPTITAMAVFVPASVGAVISFLTWRDNHRRQLEDDERHAREHAAVASIQAKVEQVAHVQAKTAETLGVPSGGPTEQSA